jgi:Ca2+-binding RTX toxin-like protein
VVRVPACAFALALSSVLWLVAPMVAAGYPPPVCERSGTTLTIAGQGTDMAVIRSGNAILVNGADCAGATVTNVDDVKFTTLFWAHAEISLRGGQLAPGATDRPDDANDEIKFRINGVDPGDPPGGCSPILTILGTDAAENFGRGTGSPDLNGDGDADVTGFEQLTIEGRGGNDRIAGDGAFQNSCVTSFHAVGGDGDDELYGGDHGGTLDGGPGNDHLVGSWYRDELRGGPGADLLEADGSAHPAESGDVLAGGPGPDVLRCVSDPTFDMHDVVSFEDAPGPVTASLADGSATNDGSGSVDQISGCESVIGSPYGDTLTGSALDEDFQGKAGDDTIHGGGGDDHVDGGDGADSLHGGDGADLLIGDVGDNHLFGDGGSDMLRARRGAETYDGGTGSDTVDLDDAGGGVVADLASGRITFADHRPDAPITGVENLWGPYGGNSLPSTLMGDAGPNVLRGHGIGDLLRGGPGDDTLQGSIADYSQVPAPVTVRDKAVTDDGQGGQDTLYLQDGFRGTSRGDDIEWDPYSSIVTIEGLGGDDRIVGGSTLDGGAGNDHLTSTWKYGARFRGGPGADVITGGDGPDTVDYSQATGGTIVRLDLDTTPTDGDGAADVLSSIESAVGSTHDDALTASGADAHIEGLAGDDVIHGGTGDDRINGGPGNDELDGGLGHDLLTFAQELPREAFSGGAKVDLRSGLAEQDGHGGRDALTGFEDVTGTPNSDVIDGDDGPNTLSSGSGAADLIRGHGGDDVLDETYHPAFNPLDAPTLEGGPGEDRLIAGKTAAVMRGGAGDDELVAEHESRPVADYADAPTGVVVHAESDTIDDGFGTVDHLAGADYVFSYRGSPHADLMDGSGQIGSRFDGAGGADRLIGGTGTDLFDGGPGDDEISGGDSWDLLTGGPGSDVVSGGNGDDRMELIDGEGDVGRCGDGTDQVNADDADALDNDCETVHRGSPPPDDPPPSDPPPSNPPPSSPPSTGGSTHQWPSSDSGAPASPPLEFMGTPSRLDTRPATLWASRTPKPRLLSLASDELVTALIRAKRCTASGAKPCAHSVTVWTSRHKPVEAETLFRVPKRIAQRHRLRYYAIAVDAGENTTTVRAPAPRRR